MTLLLCLNLNRIYNKPYMFMKLFATTGSLYNRYKTNMGRNMHYNVIYSKLPLEVVNEYKYLGILFSIRGSFYNENKLIARYEGNTQLFLIILIYLVLLINMQIELFNKTVKPILFHGCGVCGDW